MNIFKTILMTAVMVFLIGCKKQNSASIHFKIKFDPLQERLNGVGFPTGIGSGNAAQSPVMNSIGINVLELLNNSFTQNGKGAILLNTPNKTSEGFDAIDFSQVKMVKEGEIFLSVPIKDVAPGKCEWLRTSIAYQNFDVKMNVLNIPFVGNLLDERGALATFLGHNSYITKYKVAEKEDVINGVKKQGYWRFETKFNPAFVTLNTTYSGYIPAGNITFVNPIAQTSPTLVSLSSITGRFDTPLSISGAETEDITIVMTLSTNNSFEWEESINRNGKWDINAQANSGQPTVEKIIDVGLRSLKAAVSSK